MPERLHLAPASEIIQPDPVWAEVVARADALASHIDLVNIIGPQIARDDLKYAMDSVVEDMKRNLPKEDARDAEQIVQNRVADRIITLVRQEVARGVLPYGTIKGIRDLPLSLGTVHTDFDELFIEALESQRHANNEPHRDNKEKAKLISVVAANYGYDIPETEHYESAESYKARQIQEELNRVRREKDKAERFEAKRALSSFYREGYGGDLSKVHSTGDRARDFFNAIDSSRLKKVAGAAALLGFATPIATANSAHAAPIESSPAHEYQKSGSETKLDTPESRAVTTDDINTNKDKELPISVSVEEESTDVRDMPVESTVKEDMKDDSPDQKDTQLPAVENDRPQPEQSDKEQSVPVKDETSDKLPAADDAEVAGTVSEPDNIETDIEIIAEPAPQIRGEVTEQVPEIDREKDAADEDINDKVRPIIDKNDIAPSEDNVDDLGMVPEQPAEDNEVSEEIEIIAEPAPQIRGEVTEPQESDSEESKPQDGGNEAGLIFDDTTDEYTIIAEPADPIIIEAEPEPVVDNEEIEIYAEPAPQLRNDGSQYEAYIDIPEPKEESKPKPEADSKEAQPKNMSPKEEYILAAKKLAKAGGETPKGTSWKNTGLVIEYLLKKDFTPSQAVGVAANSMWESAGVQFDKAQDNGPAYGFVQWEGPRRAELEAYAKKLNKFVGDPYVQLDFMMLEFERDAWNGYAELKAAKTARDATIIFEEKFERAGAPALEQRLQYAEIIRDKFNNLWEPIAEKNKPKEDNHNAELIGNNERSKKVTYFAQYDQRWANIPVPGGSTIKSTACAPTSLAMVANTLVSDNIKPKNVYDHYLNKGLIDVNGSHQQSVLDEAGKFGLRAEYIQSYSVDAFKKVFKKGGKVILSGLTGSELLINPGHFVVVDSITGDGKMSVSDPGNEANNDKLFSLQDEINRSNSVKAQGGMGLHNGFIALYPK